MKEEGYMTVEAAFWVPVLSSVLVLLLFGCSYLYQGCFLAESAYLAAFRGSRQEGGQVREYTGRQLDALMEREVLAFEREIREVKAGPFWVEVSLARRTPLYGPDGSRIWLKTEQKALRRDPVAYIRGRRMLKEE